MDVVADVDVGVLFHERITIHEVVLLLRRLWWRFGWPLLVGRIHRLNCGHRSGWLLHRHLCGLFDHRGCFTDSSQKVHRRFTSDSRSIHRSHRVGSQANHSRSIYGRITDASKAIYKRIIGGSQSIHRRSTVDPEKIHRRFIKPSGRQLRTIQVIQWEITHG